MMILMTVDQRKKKKGSIAIGSYHTNIGYDSLDMR